jgi:hypothetical protein
MEIPTINVDPSKDSEEAVTETMANYKINREKYHSFC